jgi:S-adenosylmethionine decarboxylase proenzyme
VVRHWNINSSPWLGIAEVAMRESRLGRHLLVDFYDCESTLLDDVELIKKLLVESAVVANSTVVNTVFHHYSPYGVSGVVVIAESNVTIHTWPEYGYAAIDIFTCGETVDPWNIYEHLRNEFEAGRFEVKEVSRGVFRDGLPVRDMRAFLRSESRLDERA